MRAKDNRKFMDWNYMERFKYFLITRRKNLRHFS